MQSHMLVGEGSTGRLCVILSKGEDHQLAELAFSSEERRARTASQELRGRREHGKESLVETSTRLLTNVARTSLSLLQVCRVQRVYCS